MRRYYNDFFYKSAKEDGNISRAYYKLKELNKKYHLFKKGNVILELGCFPGGWTKAALEEIGGEGIIIGVDKKTLPEHLSKQNLSKDKHFFFINGDVMDTGIIMELKNALQGCKKKYFDICLSDLSPKITGIEEVDQTGIFNLNLRVLEIVKELLGENSILVMKSFYGSEFKNILNEFKNTFHSVKITKTEPSKRSTREVYLIGKTLNTNMSQREIIFNIAQEDILTGVNIKER